MSRCLLFTCVAITAVVFAEAQGQGGRGSGAWNPFQSNFDFAKFGAPAGFGKFPDFGSFGSGSGGFGNSGNGNGGSGRPASSGFGSFGGFPDMNKQFEDFRNQFANNFFGSGGGAPAPSSGQVAQPAPTRAPVVAQPQPGPQQPQPQPQPAATQAPVEVTQPPQPQVPVTAAPVPVPQQPQPQTPPGNSFIVTSRNCTTEGSFIGIAPSRSDPCGSVECSCFKGVYFCYSNCQAPASGQTCLATVPSGSADICPTYTDCAPQANATLGDALMFRCNAGPVHPSICWLYEITFGNLIAPWGFFETVTDTCPLASHCVCQDGFVQAVALRPEDFEKPARNLVYPRAEAGNRGAFAKIN